MSKCRFLTPCGICEIKSKLGPGIPYVCDLIRINKHEEELKRPIPKNENKTYTEKDESEEE